jgi:putative ABC transport system permease protein
MRNLLQEIRYALRMLAKAPGFTAVAVFTLALGVAGSSALFSVYNGLFLKPLPFPESERLVNLDETAPRWNLEYTGLNAVDLDAWKKQNRTFEDMGAWDGRGFSMALGDRAERIEGAAVTYNLAAVLGVQPVLGRMMTQQEDSPGGADVALISHGLWQRLFAGERSVLGRTIRLDGRPFEIVGVLPANAQLPVVAELWVPLQLELAEQGGSWWLSGIGRLKPGVRIEQAREDLTRVHKAMIPEREVNDSTAPTVIPLRERYVGPVRNATEALLGAVGLVLLIACVNVAGLTLARGINRGQEIGVRAALGASRARLIRLLLAESFVLALAGGGIGILGGDWLLSTMMRFLPSEVPPWLDFSLDIRFAAFCVALCALSAALFGLAPAIHLSKTDLHTALNASGRRTSAGRGSRRSLSALVVAEFALAVVLLVGAGLLMRAFRAVQQVEPGFRVQNMLTYQVPLPNEKYPEAAQRQKFFEDMQRRLRALPGVEAAGAISRAPLAGHSGTFFVAEGALPRRPDEPAPVVLRRSVLAGYFDSMGVALRSGRVFTEQEMLKDAPPVVIVNETFARNAWGEADAVGKRIRYNDSNAPWITVIGVARDIKHYGLEREVRPGVYLPFPVQPQDTMTLVLHTALDPLSLADAARGVLREMDPEISMYDIRTMEQRLGQSMWLRRAYSWLFGVFSAVALLLAVGGIYGVVSYTVGQRRREIGIRMALGAERRQIQGLVLRQGMRMAGLGMAIGLAAAWWASRWLESLLFGVSARDVVTYVAVTAGLAAVALLANLLPATRAARVDPTTALRYE